MDHLHKALLDANISTFLDDKEIETGGELKLELESAIKTSRASVIVLSQNYASSSWCLDELVLILEQRMRSNQIVIPIFYHVEPTHIKKQESTFGVAIAEHRQKMEKMTNANKRSQFAQKIERWTNALTQVANLKGMYAKGRKEKEFVEEIVKDIYRRLHKMISDLPQLFGMGDSIEFITSWLKDDSSESYRGGILTILDISRTCDANYNGLLDLQKQLIDAISKKSSIQGKRNTVGLALDMRMLEKEKPGVSSELETSALSNMDDLMILHLNYVQMNGSFENFPTELRWLCMHGFPLESIPLGLRMENLVALDLSYSKIVSFDICYPSQPRKRQKLNGSCSREKKLLGSLKILDLSFCEQLRRVGGFDELHALERLILTNCFHLIDICKSIEQCAELVLVDLSNCRTLKNLPRTIGMLKKVKTLLLDGCNLNKTQKWLKANNSGINTKHSSSIILEAIPSDWKFFTTSLSTSLVSLSLENTNLSNESFPTDFSCLSMLRDLYLDENPIVSLPNCLRNLPRLGLGIEERGHQYHLQSHHLLTISGD
ncbi:hypothetical protein Lser_V15G02970 [Lactuca serriola]